MLTNFLAACAHLSITLSEIQRDICEKIVILSYPLHSTPPLEGFPSEYRHPLWYGKTRMMSLPEGEKMSKICLFVLTWSTNVTDGQTDGQTLRDSEDRACIASRGKNGQQPGLSVSDTHKPRVNVKMLRQINLHVSQKLDLYDQYDITHISKSRHYLTLNTSETVRIET